MIEKEKFVFWITGANKGIGRAIADKLINEYKNSKFVLSSSDIDTIKPLVEQYKTYNNVYLIPFDLRNSNEIEKIHNKIQNTVGNVNILINNAGTAKFAPFEELKIEDLDSMMDINFKARFHLIQTVLKDMISDNFGAVINIISVAALTIYRNSSIYSASKAALLAMSRTIREEVREKNIKIVDVFPGATNTDIWDKKMIEKYSDKMMKPEDVAESVHKIIELIKNDRLMVEELHLRPQWGDL